MSDGERLAMKPSLEEAISVVYGTDHQLPTKAPIPLDTAQTTQAKAALKAAEDALRIGDWKGFGNAMQMLKDLFGEQ